MSEKEHYLKQELYERLQKDKKLFEFLQLGSLDGIWYWDLEEPNNEWMSEQFWTLLGYNPKKRKHFASEWQDIINQDDLELALENFNKHCADSNHPYDQIVRYQHKDGSTIWVRCRGMVIRDNDGKPIRMLGAHNDITSLKRAEAELSKKAIELEEANKKLQEKYISQQEIIKIKNELISIVSHELRTPLTAIRASLGILKHKGVSLSEDDLDLLNIANRNSVRLGKIVDNLLDADKLASGEMVMQFEKCSVINLINQAIVKNQLLANKNDVRLEAGNKLADIYINVDENRFIQVLDNLIANAIKFSPEKSCITLSAKLINKRARVLVMDKGCGVSDDLKEKIFDRFVQADSSDQRQASGVGLGLSLSKSLVELMQGEIGFESEEGKGTTFYIDIPL